MSQLEKTLVTYAPYPDRTSQVIIGSPCNWFCSLVKFALYTFYVGFINTHSYNQIKHDSENLGNHNIRTRI